MNEIRFIDMFGGVGGFRLGLKRASERFKCIGYYEIDKYAVQTYNKNFKENHKPTDVRDVNWSKEPDFDLICGGFPCQSFSIAGKRKGFQDTRGTLFFEICKAIESKRPKMLFLENVRGLLSHDEGATFATILRSLDNLGYDAEWQVLNSKNYGVPQNRERVFIIGHLRGECTRKIFPIREGSQIDSKQKQEFQQQISNTLRTNYSFGFSNETYAYCLDANYWKGTRNPEKRQRTMIIDTAKIRRLTPTECERLQSFPDGWTKYGITEKNETIEISDTQRYKMNGNAVTVNVIQRIGEALQ